MRATHLIDQMGWQNCVVTSDLRGFTCTGAKPLSVSLASPKSATFATLGGVERITLAGTNVEANPVNQSAEGSVLPLGSLCSNAGRLEKDPHRNQTKSMESRLGRPTFGDLRSRCAMPWSWR